MIVGLNQVKPLVSDGTLLDLHDMDINKERDKRKQETLDETRVQLETQIEVQKLQNTLAQQAQSEASMGAGLSYNPQAVIAQAEQIVGQMQQLDPGSVKSLLAQLSQEDPVMYAVVKDRWQTMQSVQRQQAVTQARGNGQPL
jgi:hypothetical protein